MCVFFFSDEFFLVFLLDSFIFWPIKNRRMETNEYIFLNFGRKKMEKIFAIKFDMKFVQTNIFR